MAITEDGSLTQAHEMLTVEDRNALHDIWAEIDLETRGNELFEFMARAMFAELPSLQTALIQRLIELAAEEAAKEFAQRFVADFQTQLRGQSGASSV